MPNVIEIVTNNETMRCRKIKIDGRTVIVRKSRCNIDSSNAKAYTVLQLLSEIGKIKDMNDEVKESITKYISDNNVKNADLFSLAKFFQHKLKKFNI